MLLYCILQAYSTLSAYIETVVLGIDSGTCANFQWVGVSVARRRITLAIEDDSDSDNCIKSCKYLYPKQTLINIEAAGG